MDRDSSIVAGVSGVSAVGPTSIPADPILVADDNGLTQDQLRAVAEQVRTAFPRPFVNTELVLIDVDPLHLHAFWTVTVEDLRAARARLGEEGATAPMVLRIGSIDASRGRATPFDVDVQGLQGQTYLDVWDEPREYRARLGLRRADGHLLTLAESNPVALPPTGPAVQAGEPRRAGESGSVAAAESPTAIDLSAVLAGRGETPELPAGGKPAAGAPSPSVAAADRHPFPTPPGESSTFDPLLMMHGGEPSPPSKSEGGSPAIASPGGTPPPSEEPPSDWATTIEPFPAPPAEAGTFEPMLLVQGHAGAEPPAEGGAGEAPPSGGGQGGGSGEPPQAEAISGGPAETPPPLALENVVSLSSFSLGRDQVDFEVNAELRIYGRAKPGSELHLFGRRVPLRPDGSFSISRPLPNGALVLSALLSSVGGESDLP